jgi:hypothetical protein
MKVLLDECVHVAFRHRITGHDVFTVKYMGWTGVKNGALLARAVADGFQAFVTTDRGVAHQQQLASLPIAVVILHAATNDLDDLEPLTPALLAALNHVVPGAVTNLYP